MPDTVVPQEFREYVEQLHEEQEDLRAQYLALSNEHKVPIGMCCTRWSCGLAFESLVFV